MPSSPFMLSLGDLVIGEHREALSPWPPSQRRVLGHWQDRNQSHHVQREADASTGRGHRMCSRARQAAPQAQQRPGWPSRSPVEVQRACKAGARTVMTSLGRLFLIRPLLGMSVAVVQLSCTDGCQFSRATEMLMKLGLFQGKLGTLVVGPSSSRFFPQPASQFQARLPGSAHCSHIRLVRLAGTLHLLHPASPSQRQLTAAHCYSAHLQPRNHFCLHVYACVHLFFHSGNMRESADVSWNVK